MKNIFRKIKEKLSYMLATQSSENYANYLRKKGVKVGIGNTFAAKYIQIDITRPVLLEIGDHNFIHKGTIILTHDWTGWCFLRTHNEFIPSHGAVKIGNNNWFGENVTICKGVTIGDNCIIGTGSVVTKSIPSNSVAAGIPARIISSYEDYYEKRKSKQLDEVIEYTKCIINSGRTPNIADYSDDYPLFVDGTNYSEYNYPYLSVFQTEENFELWKKNHKKTFADFDDFIKYILSKIDSSNGK